MNQDKKQEITKEFMESDLYYEMRDTLAKHGTPQEMIPELDGQEAIILEYSRYVPELIQDVVNVVRKHERQRILDELEDMPLPYFGEVEGPYGSGYDSGYNQALDDVKELLTNE